MNWIPYHELQHGHIHRGHHPHWNGQHKHHQHQHHHHHHHGLSLCGDMSSPKHCRWNRNVDRQWCTSLCHQCHGNTHVFNSPLWSAIDFYCIPNRSSHGIGFKTDASDQWSKKHGRSAWGKHVDDTRKKTTEYGKSSHGFRRREGQCYLWCKSDKNHHQQQTGNFENASCGKSNKLNSCSKQVYGGPKKHLFPRIDHQNPNWVAGNKKLNYHGLPLVMSCRRPHNARESRTITHGGGQKHVQWCQPLMEVNGGTTHCCNETSECRGRQPSCECCKGQGTNRDRTDKLEENSKECGTAYEEGAAHERCEDEGNSHEATDAEESSTTCCEQEEAHGSTDGDEGQSSNDQRDTNSKNQDRESCDEPRPTKGNPTEMGMDCA